MSDQQPPREKTVPANLSDSDAAMSKWIFFGFLFIAGSLIMIMAVPRILERL